MSISENGTTGPVSGDDAVIEKPASSLEIDVHEFGALWPLHLKNWFLNLITLGLYRPWATTRVRQFIIPRVSWGGERFEYTGTGKELFIGFLKVFALVFVPLGLITKLMYDSAIQAAFTGNSESLFLYIAIYLFFIFFALPALKYVSLRYRLSRSRWRGIRGTLNGSPARFGGLSLLFSFFSLLSIGLLWPMLAVARADVIARESRFGNLAGKLKPMTGYIYLIVIMIACAVLFFYVAYAVAVFAGVLTTISEGGTQGMIEQMARLQQYELVFSLFSGMLYLIPVTWFSAAFRHRFISNYSVGPISFSLSCPVRTLWWLSFTNILIMICTLRLAMPIVWRRRAVFLSTYLVIHGTLDPDTLEQAAAESSSYGEGAMLDFDII